MSKFCPHCKVELIDDSANCVLCGKATEGEIGDKKYYPKYRPVTEKRDSIISTLEKILFVGLILCVIVDLFNTKSVSWSLYVLIGVFLSYVMIFRNIKRKQNISQVLICLTFWLSLLIIFIELHTKSFGWGLQFTIPFMWLGFTLLAGILTLSKGYVDFEMFKPVILVFVLVVISFIVLCAIGSNVLWPTMVAGLVSLAEILLMFLFRFKRSIRSFKKDFGI